MAELLTALHSACTRLQQQHSAIVCQFADQNVVLSCLGHLGRLQPLHPLRRTVPGSCPRALPFPSSCHFRLTKTFQDFDQKKAELVNQGRKFVDEAKSYRTKIARLALSFVQDDCVVRLVRRQAARADNESLLDPHAFVQPRRHGGLVAHPQTQAHLRLRHRGAPKLARVS